ncbi:MAG: branched-chain amino acid ABC transporter permease [Bradyrhizobiaceae bacterium]|jgi:branched-chain amino acid transport system permease protein|nr:MAG: branched-chain amino acid ABC transporter permease [Bradyrhizobiaceae bacterium]
MQLFVNIIVLATIYALIASGYVLVYRTSRVLNLAHGELMMLGSYLLIAVASGISSSPVVALSGAALLSAFVGFLVYVVLIQRMTGQAVLAAVLATIALGVMLRGLVILIWSTQQQYPARMIGLSNDSIELFANARISTFSLTLVVVTVLIYLALFAGLYLTQWGIRTRAVGQNPLLAAQRGINLNAIYALTWGVSTFTGAAAGILISLDSGLDGTMTMIGLKAFPAALVGGLDSLVGALIGSLLIAAIEVVLIQTADPLLSDVVPFLVLIVVLAIRPWGLLGTREALDRV